ncbi:glycoside hydrolase family 36 N-terminal domain-containing protein [Streptomyces sp. NPDC057253]|uniref:glycoside hydrolase family 36 N-terminal domain-containing protein n=1 Tax=Streptomyces sp. NPDC057253 TaxID=3346069 RepID=UPI00362FC901
MRGGQSADTAGEMRYAHAAVQVRFADGVRDLEPVLAGAETAEHPDGSVTLALRFDDRHCSLTVETHYRLRAHSDVMERHLVLRHSGTEADGPVTAARADSATWMLPVLGEYWLSQSYGQWSAETQLNRTPLSCGETVFISRRGTTGHQANPWAMIDDGRAGEDHGAVWCCALAWSGTWKLTAQRLPFGRGTLAAGFGHDRVTWELRAGAGPPRAGDGRLGDRHQSVPGTATAPGLPFPCRHGRSAGRRRPQPLGRGRTGAGRGARGSLQACTPAGAAGRALPAAARRRRRAERPAVPRAGRSRDRGIVLRRARRFGHHDRPLPLRSLDPAARYRDALTGAVHHGAVLLSQGLPLDLDADDYASALVHLVREQG